MPSCFAPFSLRHTTPERWSEGKDTGVVGWVMREGREEGEEGGEEQGEERRKDVA